MESWFHREIICVNTTRHNCLFYCFRYLLKVISVLFPNTKAIPHQVSQVHFFLQIWDEMFITNQLFLFFLLIPVLSWTYAWLIILLKTFNPLIEAARCCAEISCYSWIHDPSVPHSSKTWLIHLHISQQGIGWFSVHAALFYCQTSWWPKKLFWFHLATLLGKVQKLRFSGTFSLLHLIKLQSVRFNFFFTFISCFTFSMLMICFDVFIYWLTADTFLWSSSFLNPITIRSQKIFGIILSVWLVYSTLMCTNPGKCFKRVNLLFLS